jgi:hypothetical protein
MAGGLLKLVQPILAGSPSTLRVVRIPPRFIPGKSLGSVPPLGG